MNLKIGEQFPSWRFTSPNGDFFLEEPQRVSELYFPLANEAGLMSSITPLLHGDIKTSQHSFLMTPVMLLTEVFGVKGYRGAI